MPPRVGAIGRCPQMASRSRAPTLLAPSGPIVYREACAGSHCLSDLSIAQKDVRRRSPLLHAPLHATPRLSPRQATPGGQPMASKQVTDREKSTRSVAAAAETYAAEVGAGFARELTPHLKGGEALPDVALLARLIGRKLQADTAALVAADFAHEQELSDDDGPREARDAAAAKLRSVLVDARAAIDASHGPSALTLLGLGQAVPVDPSVLATTAASVAKALRDAAIKLPKPKRAGLKVDRAAFADEIDADLPVLKKALATVAKEEREKEGTQRVKNAAMAQNDATFANGAGWLAARCILGG